MLSVVFDFCEQCDHHEIPIISNNSIINNTFAINFTSLLNIDDQEASESYDDSFALMEDYVSEEDSLEDDGHKVTPASSEELQAKEDDDEDSDFGFLATRARWSYAPGFIERMCRNECQAHAKPFGRLIGTKCQCYCPLVKNTFYTCFYIYNFVSENNVVYIFINP